MVLYDEHYKQFYYETRVQQKKSISDEHRYPKTNLETGS